MFRIKGELLQMQGEIAEAEVAFRHAIAVAHGQEAKLLELRAALSLARLLARPFMPNGSEATCNFFIPLVLRRI